MSSIYREAVLKDYLAKRDAGSLSPNLVDPTPASIRDECLLIFTKKRTLKDMKILQMFVGNRDDVEDYERALRKVDVGKFKPLQRFIYKPKTRTSNRNVELLAWLIGYSQGSFSPELSVSDRKTNNSGTQNNEIYETLTAPELTDVGGGSTDINSTIDPSYIEKIQKLTNKSLVALKRNIFVIILLIIAVAIWISSTQQQSNGSFLSLLKSDPSCMYWNGYNYVRSECGPIGQTVPFNEYTMNNLRWISCADTITEKHINRIWYIRNNNLIELFTTSGQYPRDLKRRLYPLSQRIYNKYVVAKKVKVDCGSKK